MLDINTAKQTLKQRFKPKSSSSTSKTPVDCEVLIIGAGIAGIGMAYRYGVSIAAAKAQRAVWAEKPKSLKTASHKKAAKN